METGEEIQPGTVLERRRAGGIPAAGGPSLRLDAAAVCPGLDLRGPLERGAVYLDSERTRGRWRGVAFRPRSLVREIGTQFEVRCSERPCASRVRRGRTHRLASGGGGRNWFSETTFVERGGSRPTDRNGAGS